MLKKISLLLLLLLPLGGCDWFSSSEETDQNTPEDKGTSEQKQEEMTDMETLTQAFQNNLTKIETLDFKIELITKLGIDLEEAPLDIEITDKGEVEMKLSAEGSSSRTEGNITYQFEIYPTTPEFASALAMAALPEKIKAAIELILHEDKAYIRLKEFEIIPQQYLGMINMGFPINKFIDEWYSFDPYSEEIQNPFTLSPEEIENLNNKEILIEIITKMIEESGGEIEKEIITSLVDELIDPSNYVTITKVTPLENNQTRYNLAFSKENFKSFLKEARTEYAPKINPDKEEDSSTEELEADMQELEEMMTKANEIIEIKDLYVILNENNLVTNFTLNAKINIPEEAYEEEFPRLIKNIEISITEDVSNINTPLEITPPESSQELQEAIEQNLFRNFPAEPESFEIEDPTT